MEEGGGKRVEVYVVGNILRWPPRFPPPRVHILYNLLPSRISRTVDVTGCHPSG